MQRSSARRKIVAKVSEMRYVLTLDYLNFRIAWKITCITERKAAVDCFVLAQERGVVTGWWTNCTSSDAHVVAGLEDILIWSDICTSDPVGSIQDCTSLHKWLGWKFCSRFVG